jgi:hypothetical protein
MSTAFVTGKGSTLSIATAGSGTLTYTEVKQIKTTQYSGTKMDTEDITNMDSPGAFREYAPTLNDGGQLAVDKPHISTGATTITVSLALENRLANLQRASARLWTAADQNIEYPTDSAFNWVEVLNDISLRWGD